MKTYSSCPICAGTTYSETLVCQDYTCSNETFSIVECGECGFNFTNPIPEENKIGSYYESNDYISHSNTSKGLINQLYQSVRNITLKKKLALVNKVSKGKLLLDIGSGTGEFLNVCQNAGYNCTGIEPSDLARKSSIENFSLSVYPENKLSELEKESINVITMWHVLEHVYHLNERIDELYRILKKDGTIIIAVPNRTSYDAKKYGKYWAAYDVPRHLYHFSPEDIVNLFGNHNFRIEKILPMKFDSFYVSLLSEKYKTGKANYLSAFYTGLLSNLKAAGKNNFSSQIYVIKKKEG